MTVWKSMSLFWKELFVLVFKWILGTVEWTVWIVPVPLLFLVGTVTHKNCSGNCSTWLFPLKLLHGEERCVTYKRYKIQYTTSSVLFVRVCIRWLSKMSWICSCWPCNLQLTISLELYFSTPCELWTCAWVQPPGGRVQCWSSGWPEQNKLRGFPYLMM